MPRRVGHDIPIGGLGIYYGSLITRTQVITILLIGNRVSAI